MFQEAVRERLNKYQLEKGVRWGFIAQKIGIPHYVLSFYKDGKKNLWDSSLAKLDEYLRQQGY